VFSNFLFVLQVLCVGPTGTGKTLTIADKLTTKMPKEFLPEFIVFSAKTSANQTQDLIDGKLDKRSNLHIFFHKIYL
jgi:dynein heavy chain